MADLASDGKPSFKGERDLLGVNALPLARYENESLAALAVYSVYWLRAWQLRPTLEAITILTHRLFPERFGMVSFPEYPDANRTIRSLLQSGPKYRGWLSGSNKAGYSITPSGKDLIEEMLRRVGYPGVDKTTLGLPTEPPRPSNPQRKERPRGIDYASEVKKLRNSRLFQRWREGPLKETDLIHVYSALGVFDHTPPDKRRAKLTDLRSSATKAADAEIERFLSNVEMTFPTTFGEQRGGRR